jgi:DNA end-binding protein Ku
LEARDNGIMGTLLRYPHEVREPKEFFDDIEAVETPKEMIDLAAHVIDTRAGHFDPTKFDDHYEDALRDLIKRKAAGEKLTPAKHDKPKPVGDLMEALRASLGQQQRGASPARRAAAHIARPAKRSGRRRKAS